jgi:hypothetical protein
MCVTCTQKHTEEVASVDECAEKLELFFFRVVLAGMHNVCSFFGRQHDNFFFFFFYFLIFFHFLLGV